MHIRFSAHTLRFAGIALALTTTIVACTAPPTRQITLQPTATATPELIGPVGGPILGLERTQPTSTPAPLGTPSAPRPTGIVLRPVNSISATIQSSVGNLAKRTLGVVTPNDEGAAQSPLEEMARVNDAGSVIRSVASGPNGTWVVISGKNETWATGLPEAAQTKLDEFIRANADLTQISFAPDGNWAISFDRNNGWWSDALTTTLSQELTLLYRYDSPVRQVAFAPSGDWAVVYGRREVAWSAIVEDLSAKITELYNDGNTIQQIAFAPGGGWVVVFNERELAWNNIPAMLEDEIKRLYADGENIKQVVFGSEDDSWVVLFGDNGYSTNNIP